MSHPRDIQSGRRPQAGRGVAHEALAEPNEGARQEASEYARNTAVCGACDRETRSRGGGGDHTKKGIGDAGEGAGEGSSAYPENSTFVVVDCLRDEVSDVVQFMDTKQLAEYVIGARIGSAHPCMSIE